MICLEQIIFKLFYNTVCPRPKSCDASRTLMSVTPNLCCDETKNQGTYTHMTSMQAFHSCITLVINFPARKSLIPAFNQLCTENQKCLWARREGKRRVQAETVPGPLRPHAPRDGILVPAESSALGSCLSVPSGPWPWACSGVQQLPTELP